MALGAKQDWMETQSATRQVIGGVRRLSRTSLRNQTPMNREVFRAFRVSGRLFRWHACDESQAGRQNLATTDANLAASEQGT